MAILAGVVGMLSRFAGQVLNTTLGWATLLLFGKVPDSKQWILLLIALGSIVWVILIAGVIVPDVATVTLAFVPIPAFVEYEYPGKGTPVEESKTCLAYAQRMLA